MHDDGQKRRRPKRKPFPFPYAIAAELWLFGPPARKQTVFHLLNMSGLLGSGTVVFLLLKDRLGPLPALLFAAPVAFGVGYALYWMITQLMPLLSWLVSKGAIEPPDEAKFKARIMRTACWNPQDGETK